jgi:thioredoxin-related protein
MKKLIILFLLVSFNASALNIKDIKFVNSDGKEVDLSQIDSEIIFEWSNLECPYVKRHYGSNNMQTTQKFAKSNNVIWITVISSAENKQGYIHPKDAVNTFASLQSFPDHIVIDKNGNLGKKFNAKTTPHIFIADKNKNIVYQGAIDDAGGANFWTTDLNLSTNFVKKVVNDINSSKPLSISKTRPYGCSVKYR